MTSRDALVAAASRYAALGIRVFALGPEKNPLPNCPRCPAHNAPDPRLGGRRHDAEACECLTCHGFYAATTDPVRIAAMFPAGHHRLLGVRTGTVSRLIVLDAEADADADGLPSGVELLDERFEEWVPDVDLGVTARARTGSGGLHLWYRLTDAQLDYLAREGGGRIRGGVRLLPAVDLKADGGYVVAPPSVRSSGGAYAWEPGSGPDAVAAPGDALLRWLTGERRATGRGVTRDWARRGGGGGALSRERFDEIRRTGCPDGQRELFTNMFGFLARRRGESLEQALAAMRPHWERFAQPGRPDAPARWESPWDDVLWKFRRIWDTVPEGGDAEPPAVPDWQRRAYARLTAGAEGGEGDGAAGEAPAELSPLTPAPSEARAGEEAGIYPREGEVRIVAGRALTRASRRGGPRRFGGS